MQPIAFAFCEIVFHGADIAPWTKVHVRDFAAHGIPKFFFIAPFRQRRMLNSSSNPERVCSPATCRRNCRMDRARELRSRPVLDQKSEQSSSSSFQCGRFCGRRSNLALCTSLAINRQATNRLQSISYRQRNFIEFNNGQELPSKQSACSSRAGRAKIRRNSKTRLDCFASGSERQFG